MRGRVDALIGSNIRSVIAKSGHKAEIANMSPSNAIGVDRISWGRRQTPFEGLTSE